jgi:glycosyltransferase involved in cell wall biosynthesis
MDTNLSLSIVIPIFNEGQALQSNLKEVETFLIKSNFDYELILVDDGSTDNSATIIEKFVNDKPNIIFINNVTNRGKGFSLRAGIQRATRDYILFMDADLSTPLNELEKFITEIKNTPLLIGSRRASGGLILIHQPHWKEFLGLSGNLIIRTILRLPFRDTQCGFKLLHSKTKPLVALTTIDRWGFDMELLYLARKHQYETREIGINWRNDTDSKVTLSAYFKTLIEVAKIKLNDWRDRYKL